MFKGLGSIGNIAAMVGSMQQLPEKLQELNERMKSETVSGGSSCGRVTLVMTGTGQVQKVTIADDLRGEALQQAVLEATNAAGAAAKQLYADSISQMVKDLDINVPGIDGMLKNLTGGG